MNPRLALLIAAPHGTQTAMHNDLVAMREALHRRGFGPEEILELDGQLDRDQVVAFLRQAGRRCATWQDGELFLHYSGHGAFFPATLAEARPALQPRPEPDPLNPQIDRWLFWDDLWAVLAVPPRVRITLLPDC